MWAEVVKAQNVWLHNVRLVFGVISSRFNVYQSAARRDPEELLCARRRLFTPFHAVSLRLCGGSDRLRPGGRSAGREGTEANSQ